MQPLVRGYGVCGFPARLQHSWYLLSGSQINLDHCWPGCILVSVGVSTE